MATVLVSDKGGRTETVNEQNWSVWKRKRKRSMAIAVADGPEASIIATIRELKMLPPATFTGVLLEKVKFKQQTPEGGEAWIVV